MMCSGSSSDSRGVPRKALLPGSQLHETICNMIRQQWSKAWSDVAALLDSLIVAMEQVFSVDLVRDVFALLVSSPAGLCQVDLLSLLGYGYPPTDVDEDDRVSVNPSPRLSADGSDGEEEDEEGEDDESVAGSDTTTASVVLHMSGVGFGHRHPAPDPRPGAALCEVAGSGMSGSCSEAQPHDRSDLRKRALGWRERMRSALGHLLASKSESTCARLVVSGGAFGAAVHSNDDDDEEHAEGPDHPQDGETFVRLLRCVWPLPTPKRASGGLP